MSWRFFLVSLSIVVFFVACQPPVEDTAKHNRRRGGTTPQGDDTATVPGDLSALSLPELLKLQEDGAIAMDELTAELIKRLKDDDDFLASVIGPEGAPGTKGDEGRYRSGRAAWCGWSARRTGFAWCRQRRHPADKPLFEEADPQDHGGGYQFGVGEPGFQLILTWIIEGAQNN